MGATAVWSVPAPYVPLPATWEEFEGGLGRNFSRNLRRRQRKLESELGPAVFEVATDAAGAREGLADLFRLHQAVRTLAGDRGAFASPLRRRLYDDVVVRFVNRGWLRLYTLRGDGRALASALCFHFGGKVWYYQTGYDPTLQPYGPGYLITRYAVQRAIAEGATEMDFLRGDHPYKYEWKAERRSILRLRVAATLAGRVLAPATHWLRAAKHGWKAWVGKSAAY
jgi:CelD/BcsL family acetyltransferase involved in cellulose biosynthesis